MKKIILVLTLSLVAVTIHAQKKETRDVGDFTYVSFGIHGDLFIKQGSKNEVIIEGDKESIENIETYVSGDRLKIKTESNWSWKNFSKVNVYITIKEFSGISVSGSGDAISDGVIKGDNVDLSVSGSGDIELDLLADDIDCSISGSGSMKLSGRGKAASLSISGSGKLDASEFEVETVKIRISGSGGAYVYATKELESRISGSGSVRYKGEPDKIANHSSGSGRLKKM
jgi:putative autotransporter adhesin-like protein